MRSFLEEGGFGAFTTSFEDLGNLPQLPGLAVQRLMADGYGFGAEGDWKTAILVRVANVALPAPMPNLPVGHAVWRPAPDFATSAAAWLTAGAAHHTVMTNAVGVEAFRDFAEMADTELLVIDDNTTLASFRDSVRWNASNYRLAEEL